MRAARFYSPNEDPNLDALAHAAFADAENMAAVVTQEAMQDTLVEAGPSGIKRPAEELSEGSTELIQYDRPKMPKQSRRYDAPVAKCVLRSVNTVTLAIRLPQSMDSPEIIKLKYKFADVAKVAASPGSGAKAYTLEFSPNKWTHKGSTVLVVLPDLHPAHSYSVTELQVRDAHGVGKAKANEDGAIDGCDDLRPNWLLSTDEQLSSVCTKLNKKPAPPAGRREVLTKLLLDASSKAQVQMLCNELGLHQKGGDKKEELVKRVVDTVGAGPEMARAAIAAATKTRAGEVQKEVARASTAREQAKAAAAASRFATVATSKDVEDRSKASKAAEQARTAAEEEIKKAQKALKAREKEDKDANKLLTDAERAHYKAEQATQEAASDEEASKNELRKAEEEKELADWVAETAPALAVGTVGTVTTMVVSAAAQLPTDMIGQVKLANMTKNWLATLNLEELRAIKKGLCGSKSGNKESLIEDIKGSVTKSEQLAKGLTGAAEETLRDSKVEELYQLAWGSSSAQCPPFPGKQQCLEWVRQVLRGANKVAPAVQRGSTSTASTTSALTQQRPQQQSVGGTQLVKLAELAIVPGVVHQKSPPPLDLLIVACSPNGVTALPEVMREAMELRQKMPSSSYEEAATPDKVQKLLGEVPTKRFLFCGHADAPYDVDGIRMRTLALNSPNGNAPAIVDPVWFSKMLGAIRRRGNLELVFINGCESLGLGHAVIQAGVPHVVCWESKTADEAARAFSVGFFEAVQQSMSQCGNPDYDGAFVLAKNNVLNIKRPGRMANGTKSDVSTYEFRAPKLQTVEGKVRDVSVSKETYTQKPWAAGLPVILHNPPPMVTRASSI